MIAIGRLNTTATFVANKTIVSQYTAQALEPNMQLTGFQVRMKLPDSGCKAMLLAEVLHFSND